MTFSRDVGPRGQGGQWLHQIFAQTEKPSLSRDFRLLIASQDFGRNRCKHYPSKGLGFQLPTKYSITVGANRGLSTYTQIFSPKKTGFSPVKNTSQIFFDFCLTLSYATF